MSLSLVFAQDSTYQTAKEPLSAVVIQNTFLYEKPSANSKGLIMLPAGAEVTIYGKQSEFFDMQYQSLRGWGLVQALEIQQVTVKKERAVPKTPLRKPDETQLPIRIAPYLGFVLAGKSFDNQMRIGVMTTYSISDSIALGGSMDLVLIKGTYIDIGPTFRHIWSTNSAIFSPSMDFSALYYGFDHENESDRGFGFRFGIENSSYVFPTRRFAPSITIRTGIDTMFFLFDEVRVPYWIALGAGFRF